MMRLAFGTILLLAVAPAAFAQGWDLVWSDEFNGTSVNTSNWSFEVGGGGWGNNELQYYTGGANATVSGGVLTITARRERRFLLLVRRLPVRLRMITRGSGRHLWPDRSALGA